MTDFVSLKDGTIINLGAVAYVGAAGGPAIKKRGIEILFPSISLDPEAGAVESLKLDLRGEDADAFEHELERRGIDVGPLRAARNEGVATLGLSGPKERGLPGPPK